MTFKIVTNIFSSRFIIFILIRHIVSFYEGCKCAFFSVLSVEKSLNSTVESKIYLFWDYYVE